MNFDYLFMPLDMHCDPRLVMANKWVWVWLNSMKFSQIYVPIMIGQWIYLALLFGICHGQDILPDNNNNNKYCQIDANHTLCLHHVRIMINVKTYFALKKS